MSNVTTVGIDLAKHVFSPHGVDERGAVVFRKTVSRTRLASVVAQLPACVIGLEACSGAHEWAFASVYRSVRALTDRVMCEAPTGTQSRFATAFPASPPVRRTRAERFAAIFPIDILDA